jgi:septum site-determining protein MinC
VRSGQQIYTPDGDVIILGAVSAGAEVIADGNIHVYGVLRGRALAGVKGDIETRIFCQSLEAELISIAGRYRVSEQISPADRGKPAHIRLVEDRLVIEPLNR